MEAEVVMECPSCGATVSGSNRRCSQCGEKLGWGLSPEAERLGCGIFLLLVGVVFLGGSLYYMMGQRTRQAEETVPKIPLEQRLRRGALEACRGFVEDQVSPGARPSWPEEDPGKVTRRLDTGLYHVSAAVNLDREEATEEEATERVSYVCMTRYRERDRTWALVNVQLDA